MKETKKVLMFWATYTPVSLLILFLTKGSLTDFMTSQLIGVFIVATYLSIALILNRVKRIKPTKEEPIKKEEEPKEENSENDSLVAFRFLFSKDPKEVGK